MPTIPEGPRIKVEKPEADDDHVALHPKSLEDDVNDEDGYQSDSESSDDEPVSFITRTDELYVGGTLGLAHFGQIWA